MSIYGKSSDSIILTLCAQEDLNLYFDPNEDSCPQTLRKFMKMLENKEGNYIQSDDEYFDHHLRNRDYDHENENQQGYRENENHQGYRENEYY